MLQSRQVERFRVRWVGRSRAMSKGIFVFAGALSWGAIAQAQAPNPGDVYIQNMNYSGSGCPRGSVASNLSSDGRAITLMFDSFLVEAQGGPWGGSTRHQKTCRVDLDLHVPQGWSYALFDIDFRGYVSLSNRDAQVTQAAHYAFGNRALELGRLDFAGPYDGDYVSRRQAALSSLVWSPCGANQRLTLTTDIFAKARSLAHALITVDSIDGQLTQKYGITWRRCSQPGPGPSPAPGGGSERYYKGRCRAVLETTWGTDIRDYWAEVQALDANEALRLAMDQALSQCELARRNNFFQKCTPARSSCTVH